MRQATGGQMHTLRRAGERLAAEVAASPCSAACSMSTGRPASCVAAWCGAAARACGLQNGSRAHHSLASSLCSTTMQGSSASGAAAQHVARLAIAGTRPSLALSLLPAGTHGRLLASRSHHATAAAPSRWLLRQLLGTTAKLPPRARLRAEFGTLATAAARRAATAAARRKSLNPVPTRWAIARRQLMQRAEWVLGRGYHAREAFCNAVYIQPNWSKSLLLLLAERITRGDPRLAWCFSTPVQESEDQLCQQPSEDPTNLRALQCARRLAASLLRLAWLLVLFSPVVLAAPLVGFPYIGITRLRWLRLLRWTLERAGPAFIKWGQWAATRHDLFPPDFCDELELLHTQAPAHALPFTESAVREAFGFGVSDLFSSFEADPVASGSIGQIHKGLLSDTGARLTGMPQGTVVAVKVRHPGVSESIERDFALMMAAARVAAHLPALSALRLEESLKQFAAPLREQVDLAREATHLHAFNYNFRKTSGVSFPVPLYPLVHAAVLTETFEPGTHISEYVARGAGAPHNSELARLGARTMLHMMIVDNLIHADLHPGNILVNLDYPLGGANGPIGLVRRLAAATGAHSVVETLDGWRKAKLVLLDAGMAMRLSPDDQRNMFGLFESFAQMDGTRLAHWALQFSGEEQSCPDPEVFVGEVAAFFERLTAETVATGATHGAEALAEVLELVRTHSVNMPGHICATVVTTMVLEGWSNKLDPNHSTLQEVKRMVMAVKGGWRGQLAEIMLRGELAADSEIMKRVELLEPALVRV